MPLIDQPKILVTGANGQLGMEFRQLEQKYTGVKFIFVSKEEFPIENTGLINDFLSKHSFNYCINCAAYTAVDKAETEKELALLINGTAVGVLAKACALHDIKFIHFSTDYVFDGLSNEPYTVHSPVKPANYYGYTKLTGEQLAFDNNPEAIVIRTSWVYSRFGKNFVKTMLQLMEQRPSINVVADQFGRPTYAADLAELVMEIIHKEKWHAGIFHFSNSGKVISWYDFALAICKIANLSCTINPIPTTAYPTPAKRPAYSALDIGKLSTVYQLQSPEWESSLVNCVHHLLKH